MGDCTPLHHRAVPIHRWPHHRRRDKRPAGGAPTSGLPTQIPEGLRPRRGRGKADDLPAGNGLQQAKEYAEILGLEFAYATNGREILEFDYPDWAREDSLTRSRPRTELWQRYQAGQAASTGPRRRLPARRPTMSRQVLAPLLPGDRDQPRRPGDPAGASDACCLTMATGTGKTVVAFQICWKLWTARWNRTGEHRRPRILFLADRNVLVDDPKDKTFAPFGDARVQDREGQVSQEPGDVLRHLPGDRQGRAAPGPLSRSTAGLLRSDHRR